MKLTLLLLTFVALAFTETFYQENFDEGWESRWVQSTSRPEHERGTVGLSAGKYYTNEEEESGLQTQSDARFYHLSAEIPNDFSNEGKTLAFQYSLKQDQNIDCGGGYLKLHPTGINQNNYNGDSAYNIMFGPDICGSTRRTHVILNRRGENHLITNDVPVETDTYTHVYTLIINADNTFKVLIDNEEKRAGNIEDEFAILEPKTIPDPAVSKPADWVDEIEIDDPEDVKPEGYDDIPAEIEDPEATKPDDWDDELDGDYEPSMIPNPEYQGPWRPKRIPNPAYQGEWVHPEIDNPDYEADDTLYAFDSFKYVGIEIWQVKSGSIFGNILVTDDVAQAEEAAASILERVEGEKAAENAAREAAAAAEEEEEEEVDDEDDDDKEEL